MRILTITPDKIAAMHSNEMWLMHDRGQVSRILSGHVGYLIDPSVHADKAAEIEAQQQLCVQCQDAKAFRDSGLAWDIPIQETGLVVIRIVGPLTKYGFFFGGASLLRLQTLTRMARLDERVSAVLFIFDTPGGSVAGTGDLAAEIALLRKVKPVFGYAQDMCASAGVWLMSQCTKVFCNPTAIVGSVGTIIVMYDSSKLMKDEGWIVIPLTSKDAELKAAGFAGVEFTDEAQQEFQSLVDTLNNAFVGGIMSGRRMSRSTVNALADGRVHVGPAAVEIGLVDAVKPLDDVIRELTKLARRPTASGATAKLEAIEQEGDDSMTTEPASKPGDPATPASKPGDPATPATPPSAAAPATPAAVPALQPAPAAAPIVDPQAAPPAASTTRPATVKEIDDRFPESTADFRLGCIRNGLSMAASMDVFLAVQQTVIDRQQEELAKRQPTGGVQSVGTIAAGTTGAAVDTSDPAAQWHDLVAEEKKTPGITNAEAIARAAENNPDVHAAYLLDHNEQYAAMVHGQRPKSAAAV